MIGLLNLDKPAGMTSRDAVNRVKWKIDPIACGHAGTLDPLATGVLVVAVGRATRLIEYVQQYPKRYLGTFLFGQTSDTEDIDGQLTTLVDPPQPTREAIVAALPNFRGEIQQRPPAYSALKVDGKRSYKLARRGKEVEHAPREVTIHDLELIEYEYPRLVLDIRCSSGTYVRSLGRDLAELLGTGAVMSELRRTEIGPFHVNQAHTLAGLSRGFIQKSLQPSKLAVANLPQLQLSRTLWIEIQHGRLIATPPQFAGFAEIAAITPAGDLGAILIPRDNALGPERVFPPETE